MNKIRISVLWMLGIALLSGSVLQARENTGQPIRQLSGRVHRIAGGCAPATAAVDLDINNVRARILNGGDMWWDLSAVARYEIPKVTEANGVRRTSLFAGALWIGGYERSNLKLAAMTYRQSGSDFFPGPMDTVKKDIDAAQCLKYDKIYKLNKSDIDKFIASGVPTDDILNWPGNPIDGNNYNQSLHLAPFKDLNNNGIYEPGSGEYPDIRGDQALWFVFNDAGNVHSETKANPIGLEVRTMAFGFQSNDQISNMTFYRNTIINRGTSRLDSTFFGQWVDPDLGYAYDDYVACDTSLNLGICYNGEDVDPGATGYGINPPSIGVDFFKGPLADPNDKVDNNKNGVIDEAGETIGMSKFMYYDNDFSFYGNPENPEHYYQYLVAKWKNNKPLVKDFKDGHGTSGVTGAPRTNYIFPGDPTSDNKSEWNERNAGNKPGDRRFLESAGPFTLKLGAVNEVVVGVVWARATSGGPTGSINELKFADTKAQILYDNNFQSILGPEPPQVEISELDQKLVLTLVNREGSIKNTEGFNKNIPNGAGGFVNYKFEGYQIYQLKNSQVTSAELGNADRARLIAQVDLKNDIGQLVNEEFDAVLSSVKVLKVKGDNKGIRRTFLIDRDLFASGNDALVNSKFYYYTVIAYAANTDANTKEKYLAGKPSEYRGVSQLRGMPQKVNNQLLGNTQNADYGTIVPLTRLEGQGNGGVSIDLNQSSVDSFFSGPKTDFLQKAVYSKNGSPASIRVYDPLRVPDGDFEFRITDTSITAVPANDFIRLDPAKTKWTLTQYDKGTKTVKKVYTSDVTVGIGNEQAIPEIGMVVNIRQPDGPASTNDSVRAQNGFIEASMTFKQSTNVWLTGIHDQDPVLDGVYKRGLLAPTNWIRSGGAHGFTPTKDIDDVADDYYAALDPSGTVTRKLPIDPNQVYEKVLDGIIAPAALASRSFNGLNGDYTSLSLGPMPAQTPNFVRGVKGKYQTLAGLQSVDIVFTSDKSKWTKCLVVEMGEDQNLTEGNQKKFYPRKHTNPFVTDGSGVPQYKPGVNKEEGFSWFPGYAVNLETGERLNIIFGEDSYLQTENGGDMLWNPTNNNWQFNYQNLSSLADPFAFITRYTWGGKHWFWVMASRFDQKRPTKACYDQGFQERGGVAYAGDSGKKYASIITSTVCESDPNNLQAVWNSALWTMCPVLTAKGKLLSVEEGLIPTDTRIRLRVEKPYQVLRTRNSPYTNNGMPLYTFSTDGLAPTLSNQNGREALKNCNIVPNPYYASSEYETSQLDNRVRITNLPANCKVTIMSIEGTIVRRYNVAQGPVSEVNPRAINYVDWDLKNEARVPIASGAYIIHIDAGALGQRVIKWFGVVRPIDLDTF